MIPRTTSVHDQVGSESIEISMSVNAIETKSYSLESARKGVLSTGLTSSLPPHSF